MSISAFADSEDLQDPVVFDSIKHNRESNFTRAISAGPVTMNVDDNLNFVMTFQTQNGPETLKGRFFKPAQESMITGDFFCRQMHQAIFTDKRYGNIDVRYYPITPVRWCLENHKKTEERVFILSWNTLNRIVYGSFESATTTISHSKP